MRLCGTCCRLGMAARAGVQLAAAAGHCAAPSLADSVARPQYLHDTLCHGAHPLNGGIGQILKRGVLQGRVLNEDLNEGIKHLL